MKPTASLLAALGGILLGGVAIGGAAKEDKDGAAPKDILTPRYYRSAADHPIRAEVDRFLSYARKDVFRHPLEDDGGQTPRFHVPREGRFGAGKGPGGDKEHHTGVDLHIGEGKVAVVMCAAHGGRVTTFRNAPKFRHYLAVTKDVVDDGGKKLGKIVTIYGHLDLDLDEADGLALNGKVVRKGDVVSRHLYAGTLGGPHLHFEIRYYRAGDVGTETFYGFRLPGLTPGGTPVVPPGAPPMLPPGRPGIGSLRGPPVPLPENPQLTEKPAGPWSFGYWDPAVGYGFADPRNHGVALVWTQPMVPPEARPADQPAAAPEGESEPGEHPPPPAPPVNADPPADAIRRPSDDDHKVREAEATARLIKIGDAAVPLVMAKGTCGG